jgi:RNA polymerase primary sigma factor
MHADDAGRASFKTDVAHGRDLGGAVLNPLLRMAIITGVETAVALHISRGDELNARDGDGHTPLMLCALRNRPRICALLLAAGANAELTSHQGKTAFEIAIEKGVTALGVHNVAAAMDYLSTKIKGFWVEMPLDWGQGQGTPKNPANSPQSIAQNTIQSNAEKA